MNYDKLKEDSENQFKSCISILNSEKKVKESFFYLLYGDLINIKKITNKNNKINSYVLVDILDEPEIILKDYFDSININSNHINIFNKKLKENKKNIINKLNECNNNIDIIKLQYNNLLIKEFLPIEEIKFNFEKKTVLNISDPKYHNLILGEFFARFIFSLINKKEKKINNILSTDVFYDDENINSYYNIDDKKIINFNDIHINFKYWNILLYLIGSLFSDKSNYNIIFNNNEFDKHISSIFKNDQKKYEKKDEKKEKRKNGKKIRGSRNNNVKKVLKDILDKGKGKNKDKNKDKQNEIQKIYNQIFNQCFVYKDNNYIKLNNIYVLKFKENMKDYFKNIIIQKFEMNGKDILDTKNIILNNPFNNQIISLKELINYNENTIKKDELDIIFKKDINFDIFQFLFIYGDINNKKEIYEFIFNISNKLILLLFYLYSIKKKLYEEYIIIIDERINKNNSNNNNSGNNNSNNNNSGNNNSGNNNSGNNNSGNNNSGNNNSDNNFNSENQTKDKKTNNESIDIRIKKITKNIEKLKLTTPKSITEFDTKIIELENKIKDLLVQKYTETI